MLQRGGGVELLRVQLEADVVPDQRDGAAAKGRPLGRLVAGGSGSAAGQLSHLVIERVREQQRIEPHHAAAVQLTDAAEVVQAGAEKEAAIDGAAVLHEDDAQVTHGQLIAGALHVGDRREPHRHRLDETPVVQAVDEQVPQQPVVAVDEVADEEARPVLEVAMAVVRLAQCHPPFVRQGRVDADAPRVATGAFDHHHSKAARGVVGGAGGGVRAAAAAHLLRPDALPKGQRQWRQLPPRPGHGVDDEPRPREALRQAQQ